MTREEIIEHLDSIVGTYEILLGHGVNSDILDVDDIEAIKEAISALSENKGDLISRQAILDELEKWDWQELYLPIHFKQILDDVPSVENKGEWIPMYDRWGDIVTTVCGYECSKCGEWNADNDNFCPNCGADMRGEPDVKR